MFGSLQIAYGPLRADSRKDTVKNGIFNNRSVYIRQDENGLARGGHLLP